MQTVLANDIDWEEILGEIRKHLDTLAERRVIVLTIDTKESDAAPLREKDGVEEELPATSGKNKVSTVLECKSSAPRGTSGEEEWRLCKHSR